MAGQDAYVAIEAELPRVKGRHRNRALAAARQARAVELLTSGRTYQQVADELGYTSRGTVHNVVAKALREQTAEPLAASVV
jgi:DNA-binding NarL/FixJ family response regulator